MYLNAVMTDSLNQKWRYFGVHSGSGSIRRIVRCPANEISVIKQNPSEIQTYSGNGVWEFNEAVYGVMMNDYCTGWFDPEDDEIPESKLKSAIEGLTVR